MGKFIDVLELSMRVEMLTYLFHPIHRIWYRMEGFTELTPQDNVEEFTRKFAGNSHETTDIVARTKNISYNFDFYADNPVLEYLKEIHVGNCLGSDAVVSICTIQKKECSGWQSSTAMDFVVVPSNYGGSTNCLSFAGIFKQNSPARNVLALPDECYQTIAVTEV